jgi:hypothetical protein
MRFDWKRLPFIVWLFAAASVGFFVYGIYCIIMRQGLFVVPFHSVEAGSIGDGMAVQGTAAVRTGIGYILFALFMGGSAFLKAQPEPDEKMARNVFFLFIAAILCLLWAMFSM